MNRKALSSLFTGLTKKDFLALVAILILALALRLMGDSCVTDSAKLWEHVDTAEYFFQEKPLDLEDVGYPKGYPSLLFISFILFGKSFNTIFWLNVVASSLTAISVFFITFLICKHKITSYFASLVYVAFPLSIHYSQISSEMICSVFFLSVATIFALVALELKTTNSLALAFTALVLAASFRLENLVLVAAFTLTCLFFFKRKDLSKFFIPISIALLLSLALIGFFLRAPYSFGFIESNVNDPLCQSTECFIRKFFPNARPSFFTLDFFTLNLSTLLSFLMDENFFPLLILFFLPFSLGYCWRNNRKAILLLLWVLGFFMGFSLYWATWFVGYELYMLQLTVPLSALAALGASFLYETSNKLPIPTHKGKFFSLVIFAILLSFLFFRMFTHTDVHVKKEKCFFDELYSANKFIANECIAVDNIYLDLRTPAKRVFEYFFYGKRIVSEPECKHYIYFKLKDNFTKPIDKHPLMSFFKEKCQPTKLKSNSYFELFRVVCE
jgi:hypothetical protein